MRPRDLEIRVARLEASHLDMSRLDEERRIMAAFCADLKDWIEQNVPPDPLASRAERLSRHLWPEQEAGTAYRNFIADVTTDPRAMVLKLAAIIYEKEIKDR